MYNKILAISSWDVALIDKKRNEKKFRGLVVWWKNVVDNKKWLGECYPSSAAYKPISRSSFAKYHMKSEHDGDLKETVTKKNNETEIQIMVSSGF